jgi:hypothetical protein
MFDDATRRKMHEGVTKLAKAVKARSARAAAT